MWRFSAKVYHRKVWQSMQKSGVLSKQPHYMQHAPYSTRNSRIAQIAPRGKSYAMITDVRENCTYRMGVGNLEVIHIQSGVMGNWDNAGGRVGENSKDKQTSEWPAAGHEYNAKNSVSGGPNEPGNGAFQHYRLQRDRFLIYQERACSDQACISIGDRSRTSRYSRNRLEGHHQPVAARWRLHDVAPPPRPGCNLSVDPRLSSRKLCFFVPTKVKSSSSSAQSTWSGCGASGNWSV
jgi:hypothetical protein